MDRVLDLIGYHPTSRRVHGLRGACPFHAPERPPPRCLSVELTKVLFLSFDCGAQGTQGDLWSSRRSLPLHETTRDRSEYADVRIPIINSDSATQQVARLGPRMWLPKRPRPTD